MKLVSVNVGLPRKVVWRGKAVMTSIWKEPVAGRIRVSKFNLDGDRQSDSEVHGGIAKAVYAYPGEHYPFWRGELPNADLPWGAFGENFTIEGLLEDQVRIGARIRAGSAEFVVTQPRMPCFKLGIRLGRPDVVKRFLRSGRTGFYLAVTREGEVAAGDPIECADSQEQGLTVADVANLYTADPADTELLRRASELPALPEGWKARFRERLREAGA